MCQTNAVGVEGRGGGVKGGLIAAQCTKLGWVQTGANKAEKVAMGRRVSPKLQMGRFGMGEGSDSAITIGYHRNHHACKKGWPVLNLYGSLEGG
jgi:hypothetical protein